jgi:hypothetical protein
VAQAMYTHVSKHRNDKIKERKKKRMVISYHDIVKNSSKV